jgi:hypothetical protein
MHRRIVTVADASVRGLFPADVDSLNVEITSSWTW